MAATPPGKQRTPSIARTWRFFEYAGMFEGIPKSSERREFFSDLIRGLLKVDHIERGRVTCSLTVKPPVTNPYNTLHGGVVAAVAEMVALACARTVAGDKEFFLGESSTSYLSATRLNTEVEVNGFVQKHGRSLIVTSVELRIKKTKQLCYTSRATFYVMPVASL